MMLEWTATRTALRETYRQIGERLAAAYDESRATFDTAGWNLLCDAGLWRLVVPADFGGHDRGAGWWDFSAALEGLASAIRTPELLLSVIGQAGMVRALAHYGSPAQKARYFEAILCGEVSATCIAEPGTGTDVRSIGTALVPDGDGYRLTGSKYNIAHAPIARFMLVVARMGESNDISLVLLDQGTEGLSAGAPDDKLGNRNLPTGPLFFDAVRVAPDQILGRPGKGLQQLIDIISLGRLYYGLAAAHLVTPFLADAMRYAETRDSFNEPIAAHQYVQKRLIDIRIGTERNRWMAYGALNQLLNKEPEALMSCSIAKLAGAQDLIDSATSLLKLYGSVGYHSNEVSALVRNALGFASVGGTEEMHRKNIYNQLVRLAR